VLTLIYFYSSYVGYYIYEIEKTHSFYGAMIMEYVEYTLEHWCGLKNICIAQKLNVLISICDGLLYLHENKVIHRDLKPVNILVDKSGRPVIADFGEAKILASVNKNSVLLGTAAYMAPEIFDGGHYDFMADVYSLGIIIWRVFTGLVPYQGVKNKANVHYDVAKNPKFRPKYNEKYKAECLEKWEDQGVTKAMWERIVDELCPDCWSADPDDRPGLVHIQETLTRICHQLTSVTKKDEVEKSAVK
jgi:serine/threonine protein kinase